MTELIIYLRKRRKVQLSIVSLCMFLLCTTNLYAQSPVRGVVTDDSGYPLPGVTVMVKSARSGVVTDMDGAWIIQADPRSTLTFSYIGMITQEVKVGGQDPYRCGDAGRHRFLRRSDRCGIRYSEKNHHLQARYPRSKGMNC